MTNQEELEKIKLLEIRKKVLQDYRNRMADLDKEFVCKLITVDTSGKDDALKRIMYKDIICTLLKFLELNETAELYSNL